MSGLHFDSLDDCPPGLRALIEKQNAKQSGKPNMQQHFANGGKTSADLEAPKKTTRKYRNMPTERLLPNGECIKFGSKKEAAYYDSLMAQQKAGVVRDIRLQYQFLIKAAYTDACTGERFRAIYYLADFVFEKLEDGKWVKKVVDTKGGGRKGTETKTFIMKRKLLAEQGVIIETA